MVGAIGWRGTSIVSSASGLRSMKCVNDDSVGVGMALSRSLLDELPGSVDDLCPCLDLNFFAAWNAL